MWCPDHDPILAAGFIPCATCGRRAWPITAAWVGDLVLATYAPGCDHLAPETWLADPAQLTPDARWCGVLTTSSGEPCRQRRPPDGGPCRFHARRKVH